MMKILIYAHAFAPKVGGAETLVMLLAQGLSLRAEVTAVTPTPADGFNDSVLPFRVVRQPSLWELSYLLRKADVIHVAGPCFLPLFLGLLFRKPTVVEHHGFQTICPNGLLLYEPTQMPCPGHFMARRHYECLRCNAKYGKLRSFKMWLLTFPHRWLCYWASINIVLTKWLGTALSLPRTNIIYCGIPVNTGRNTLRPLCLPLTFGFMGRLVSTKGVHILIEAAHILRAKGLSFQLKIIGDGPERKALEAQSEALDLNDWLTFMGYLPQELLEKALDDIPIIIMPSLSGETFGLVAAENMMCGRLVIVSDIGVLSEVVGDAGLKFPPGDAEALASCLQKILETPELITELRLKAQRRAFQLFRQERMVEDHISLCEEILWCKYSSRAY